MAKMINLDTLSHYHGKMKTYVQGYVGSNVSKQVDLSSSTNTSFALNANTLYILPDVSGEVSITLTQPETGVAKVWEFVVKVINGSIAFPDSIDINPAFSFTSHTKYYVRVINNALTATAVGDPGTIYLYNANGQDPLCQDMTGGWYFNKVGMVYRASVAGIYSDKRIYLGFTSSNGSYAAANACAKNEIDFQALIKSGRTKLCAEFSTSGVDNNGWAQFVVSHNLPEYKNLSFNEANLKTVYGQNVTNIRAQLRYNTQKYNNAVATISLHNLINYGITKGFVTFLMGSSYNGNINELYTYVNKIWFE